MFDPLAGRFLQEDPEGFAAGDANLYRYVGNGPTNATDPSGLQEHKPIKIFPPTAGAEDYPVKDFPDEAHDVSAIVFHVLLSGFPPKIKECIIHRRERGGRSENQRLNLKLSLLASSLFFYPRSPRALR